MSKGHCSHESKGMKCQGRPRFRTKRLFTKAYTILPTSDGKTKALLLNNAPNPSTVWKYLYEKPANTRVNVVKYARGRAEHRSKRSDDIQTAGIDEPVVSESAIYQNERK